MLGRYGGGEGGGSEDAETGDCMAGGGDGRGEEGTDEMRVVVDGLKSHGAMYKVVVRQRGVGLEG